MGFPKEISASFFRSVANRSQVVNTHALRYGHAYNDTYKHMAFCNEGRREDPVAVSKV